MSRDEIQKLLGGYATDTLNEAERRALFEAALEDQELFDALAKDQALRDVLREPAARRQLIAALGPEREPFGARAWRWWRQPAALAMAGGLAGVLIVTSIVFRPAKRVVRPEAIVADAIAPRSPAPMPAAPPAVKQAPKAMRPAARAAKVFQRDVAAANQPAASAPLPAPPVLPPAAAPSSASEPLATGGVQSAADAQHPAAETGKPSETRFNAVGALPQARLKRAAAGFTATPGIEYSLLAKGADGSYSPLPAGSVLHAGDSVRLRVAPGSAGFLRLYEHAGAGWNLIAGQRVEPGQSYLLPSGALESSRPARMELMLVLSAQERDATVEVWASKAEARKKTSGQPAVSRMIDLEFR